MAALDGRVALVTGGSKGLGAAVAHGLAGLGARVVITYRRDRSAAEALVTALPGGSHRACHAPAQDTAAIETAVRSIAAGEGRLDILVNNAGSTRVIPHREIAVLDDAVFDQIVAVNLRGPFAAVRACHELLQASGQGLIVNVTSVAGFRGGGSNIAYAAAKAGLNAMTMSLARAFAPAIRVVGVAPGLMDTPMSTMWGAEGFAQRAAGNPLRRPARPDEVAAIVVGLATTMTFVNGTIIVCDGGGLL